MKNRIGDVARLKHILEYIDEIEIVDQTPIGKSPNSSGFRGRCQPAALPAERLGTARRPA